MSTQQRVEHIKKQVEGMTSVNSPILKKSAFLFYKEGFNLEANNINKFYRWNEIQQIKAYKRDLLTIGFVR